MKSDTWLRSGAAEAQTERRGSARGRSGRPLTGMTEEVTVGCGGRSGDASPGFERWRLCFRECAPGVTAPQARPRPRRQLGPAPRAELPGRGWPLHLLPEGVASGHPPLLSQRVRRTGLASTAFWPFLELIEGLGILGLPQ